VIACPAGLATYTADGWYLYVPANEASTVSIQGPVGRFGSQYSAKVQRNAGQTGVGQATFGFPLDTDELYPMQGKFVRLSFMAQAGANWSPASGNLSVLVVVGTGAPQKVVVGFTGAVGLINAVAALTASPTRFQFNASVACPTNASQAEVYFQYTPVGTAGADDSFYIDDVQLEIVPAATGYVSSDFERLNFQEQLLLCQRHYQKTFPYETAPAFNSSTEALYSMQPIGASVAAELGTIRLPVPMRVGFTGVIWNIGAANNQIRNVGLGIDWSVSQLYTGRNVYRVGGTTPAGSALYQTTGYQATMDAGI
jgi:hypothetical protein